MHTPLAKYLRKRAVSGPWQLPSAARQNYRAAIIIPSLAEAQSLPQTLASLANNPPELLQQTAVLVVVNNRASASAADKADNRATLKWLQQRPLPQLQLYPVDACSPGKELPEKEGVGLVRKIGCDLALELLDWQQAPLLISLDADTLVDADYLPALFTHFAESRCGGATLPFRHQSAADPQQEAAIRSYELYLRSYLFGLQQAGSPYAYHSIGSAFACRAECYLAVGGMNRRQAGEDFYFLQQLAKSGGVEMLYGTCVQPSARFSTRVPFGTGRAVEEQLAQGRQPFQFTSARSFRVLRSWLLTVAAGLERPAGWLLQEAESIAEELQAFLLQLDFARNWQRLQQNHRPAQRLQAFHGWFDALRSRQLLTRLDADCRQSADQRVAELLAWGGYPGREGRPAQLALLEHLQGGEKS